MSLVMCMYGFGHICCVRERRTDFRYPKGNQHCTHALLIFQNGNSGAWTFCPSSSLYARKKCTENATCMEEFENN